MRWKGMLGRFDRVLPLASVLALTAALTSCASRPKAATLFAPGEGECTEPGGCEAPVEAAAKYAPPDEDRPAPATIMVDLSHEPNCLDVAAALAAIEVGNYADAEVVAEAVARHEATCRRTKLDARERRCIMDSTDREMVAYCAPRLEPEQHVELVAVAECDRFVRLSRAQLGRRGEGPPAWDQHAARFKDSCEQDRWPVGYANCIRDNVAVAYPLQVCLEWAPRPLRKRLLQRFADQRKPDLDDRWDE